MGIGAKKGHKVSEETRQKLREKMKQIWQNQDYRQNSIVKHTGKIMGEDTKQKLRILSKRPNSGQFTRERSLGNKINLGRKPWNFRGEKTIHSKGYIWLYLPLHPNSNVLGRVLEHRIIMEKHLGRYLTDEEVIHHINGDTSDNRLGNLELFSSNEKHLEFHHLKRKENG